ncbi:hypothetical protein KUV89_04390 [Marinobacter hydrocarbonoclasticus]|nr:hypothetical protein [Marinobacter nauticus]
MNKHPMLLIAAVVLASGCSSEEGSGDVEQPNAKCYGIEDTRGDAVCRLTREAVAALGSEFMGNVSQYNAGRFLSGTIGPARSIEPGEHTAWIINWYSRAEGERLNMATSRQYQRVWQDYGCDQGRRCEVRMGAHTSINAGMASFDFDFTPEIAALFDGRTVSTHLLVEDQDVHFDEYRFRAEVGELAQAVVELDGAHHQLAWDRNQFRAWGYDGETLETLIAPDSQYKSETIGAPGKGVVLSVTVMNPMNDPIEVHGDLAIVTQRLQSASTGQSSIVSFGQSLTDGSDIKYIEFVGDGLRTLNPYFDDWKLLTHVIFVDAQSGVAHAYDADPLLRAHAEFHFTLAQEW